MKKYLTYRTATIAGWVGIALVLASIFIPRPWDMLAYLPAITLCWTQNAAYWHRQGYEKGRTERLKVEINRVWAEQQPFTPEPKADEWPNWFRPIGHPDRESNFTAKTFREGADK